MVLDRPPVPLRPVRDLPTDQAHVLAVDLGTGGPKVAVVAGAGRVVAHAFEPVGFSLLGNGAAEQDPRQWWSAVAGAARRALAESGVAPESVVGVGCTAQWLGTVVVGGDGEPVGDAVIWMDSRGSEAVRRQVGGTVNVLGYSPGKAARWIRKTGGAPSLSGKDPVGHILYLRQHEPERYRAARVFLEPVDFLNLRLTGLARASHDSITMHWVTDNRHIGQIAYDPELLGITGLDRATLPELVPTGATLGGLCAQAAGELGLLEGTPVVTGTGDLHSAAVGSGAVADYAGHLYIGTSSWVSCHVPFKKVSPLDNVTSIPSGIPGRYLVADEHETAGVCLTWLRDSLLFADDGLTAPAPGDALATMNDLAATVAPGSGGVLFTPWLNGERTPVDDHTIRAGFHNLSLSTTRAEMVRAVFEGVALNTRWLLGPVEKFVGRRFGPLAFVGGGANSDLWSQVHADVTGRTIRQVADPVLANVRGAALLTLMALGRVQASDIPPMVEIKAEYRPDRSVAPVYDELAAEFVNLYKAEKPIHRRLNHARVSGG